MGEKDIIGRLKLIIHRGKKLEKRGMFGKADPYIIIRYLDAKLKSKTVKNSVNPDWDFTTNIDIIDERDQEVLLQVFDDDIGKDDPMGQAIINLKEFKEKGSVSNQWIRLEKCKSGQILISGEFNRESQDKQKEDENKESTISTTYTEQRYEEPGLIQQNEEMDKRSQKEITPIQIEEKTPTSEYKKTDDTVSSPKKTLEAGQICITVYKARDIEKRGKFGKADPYVKMTLGNQKAKSATVKNNHNPEWNFKATFDVDQNTTQNINIAVFDDDFGKDDSLGSTLLDISKVQEHHQLLNQWIPLEKCKSGAVLLSAEFVPVEKVKQQKQIEADKNNKEEVDNSAEFATQEITKKDNQQVENIQEAVKQQHTAEKGAKGLKYILIKDKNISSKMDKQQKEDESLITTETVNINVQKTDLVNIKSKELSTQEKPTEPVLEIKPVAVSQQQKPLVAGQVVITVYKARDIEKKGMFGKADPYVKMTLGKQNAKSATVKNNHNPEWNFKAIFDVDQNTTEGVHIAVFDDDFGKDDSLGSTLLDISKVQEHQQLLNQW